MKVFASQESNKSMQTLDGVAEFSHRWNNSSVLGLSQHSGNAGKNS